MTGVFYLDWFFKAQALYQKSGEASRASEIVVRKASEAAMFVNMAMQENAVNNVCYRSNAVT